jgi:hypothetical protein
MKAQVYNINPSLTINSRHGESIFCSDFTGRNIADTGVGCFRG